MHPSKQSDERTISISKRIFTALSYISLGTIVFVFVPSLLQTSHTSRFLNTTARTNQPPYLPRDTLQKVEQEHYSLPVCGVAERLKLLRKTCAKQKNILPIGRAYHRLLVDENHKVLYCVIPKTGCTTWKHLLVNLSGYVQQPGERVPVHGTAINKYGFRYMHQYPMTERIEILNNPDYKKFIIVRNPFDRLVSAYRNKFVEIHYRGDIIRRIKLRFRGQSRDKSDVTFAEFVTFLSDSYTSGKDMHWERFEELCQPCAVKYDFIFKLETVHVDLPRLVEGIFKVNSSISSVPVMNKGTNSSAVPSSTYSKVLEQFNRLPEKVIKNLFEVYKFDFEAFGYTFDTMNSSAKCERGGYKNECC